MTLRSSFSVLGGLLLGAAVLAPAPADAQVPVTKEPRQPMTGQRMPVMQRDTVQIIRLQVDTIYVDRTIVRVDTVMVRDTVYQVTRRGMLGRRARTGGAMGGTMDPDMNMQEEELADRFFFSLGGGATFPTGDFGDAYDTGWNAMAALGIRTNSPFAIRAVGTYNNFGGGTIEDIDTIELDDSYIWSAGGDVLLDLAGARSTGIGLYLLGGGGYYGLDEDAFGSSGELGVNAGAGLRFGFGGARLFVEGKWTRVFLDDDDIDFIPVTLGISF